MLLDQKVEIAAQLHVDDTYLPTNKQPPPSSIYQPPLYDNMLDCCVCMWCACV